MRSLNADRNHAGLFRRVVVSTRKQGIAYVKHLLQGNAKDVSQFSDSIGLVYAGLSNVDGCRATHSDGKFRDEVIDDRLDLFSLGKVCIPFRFFVQGSLLA